jgi:hypothetical protein
MMSTLDKPRKWYQIKWFQDYDTQEERKLIVKLDLLIVPYVFVVCYITRLCSAWRSDISFGVLDEVHRSS